MSGHALEVLEFPRVLERIARRASSRAGREGLLSLRPRSERGAIADELARVGAVMRFLDEQPGWGMPPIPDVAEGLGRLAVQGSLLEPSEVHGMGVLMASSRRLFEELTSRDDRFSELEALRALLVDEQPLERVIERAVDADGQVLDSASKDLKRVRDRLRGAHTKIVRKLESYVASLPERFLVPDGSVTIREGRYVIPLRREGKREVGGIVHDESQTGATVYIEPPSAIELMNQLRDLEGEEAREIRRILGDLTERLVPERDALAGAHGALADFDSLHARARVAREWRATVPEIVEVEQGELRIRDGRHPLLVEGGGDVVPFDLDLGFGERAIVVSGPNTGGKSVFLKAIGLIAALAQSGIVPPVGKGTRLSAFESFYADIGDEQSIAQSLSTFSAHLANLSEIVSGADRRSLVLIDEMGTGTDPAEGAALSRALLEELVARGARTIVSSHLGELKRLDVEESGIVNASLEFDSELMEPTYRLVKGRPGRSYGLAIARRLGFPGGVLDRAEAYRDDDEARMEEVLARLERREREAERLVHELDLERAQTSRLRSELEAREEKLRDAESTAGSRAKETARKLLLEARTEVEEAVREVRQAADEGADLDEAIRSARRRVEAAADRQRSKERRVASRKRQADPAPGDRVRIRETGAKGRLAEVRADRALVELGGLKLEVRLDEIDVLEPLPREAPPAKRRSGWWSGPPTGQARSEVDLRGMRVHEVDVELTRALDQAVLEDLAELRIIHGKGTGALRQRVGELLESDGRVKSVRMGGPTEGGAGVTVASFRAG